MKYPLDFGSAEVAINNNRSFKGGFYPIGENNLWHGGIHLQDDKAMKPISPILDGKLIAYRISEDYISPEELPESLTEEQHSTFKTNLDFFNSNRENKIPNPYSKTNSGSYSLEGDVSDDDKHLVVRCLGVSYSNNFVLLKHELKTPEGEDKDNIVFYTLYMHLMPFRYLYYPGEYVDIEEHKEQIEGELRTKSPFYKEWLFKLNSDRDNKGVQTFKFENEKKEGDILPFGYELEMAEDKDVKSFSKEFWAVKDRKDKEYCRCYIPGKNRRTTSATVIVNKKNLVKNEGKRNIDWYYVDKDVEFYHPKRGYVQIGKAKKQVWGLKIVGHYSNEKIKIQVDWNEVTVENDLKGFVKLETLDYKWSYNKKKYYRVKNNVVIYTYRSEDLELLQNSKKEDNEYITPLKDENEGHFLWIKYGSHGIEDSKEIKPIYKRQKPMLYVGDGVRSTGEKGFDDYVGVEYRVLGFENEICVKKSDLKWYQGERYRLIDGGKDIKDLEDSKKGLAFYANNSGKSKVNSILPKDSKDIKIYDTASLLKGSSGFYLANHKDEMNFLNIQSSKDLLCNSQNVSKYKTDGTVQVVSEDITITSNDILGYCGDYCDTKDILHFELFFNPDDVGFLKNEQGNSAKVFRFPKGLSGYKKAAVVEENSDYIPLKSTLKILTPESDRDKPPFNGWVEVEVEKLRIYIHESYVKYDKKEKKAKIVQEVKSVFFHAKNVGKLITVDENSELAYIKPGFKGYTGYDYTVKDKKFKGWLKLDDMDYDEVDKDLIQIKHHLGKGGKKWYKSNGGAPSLTEDIDYVEKADRLVKERDMKVAIATDEKVYYGITLDKTIGWLDEARVKALDVEDFFDWNNYFEEFTGKVEELVSDIEAVGGNTANKNLVKEEVWNAVKDETMSEQLLKHYGKHSTEWDKKGFNLYKKVLKKRFDFNKLAGADRVADNMLFWDDVTSLPRDGKAYYFHPVRFIEHVRKLDILTVHPYPDQKDKWPDNPGFIPVDSKGVPVNPNPAGLFNADYSRYYGKTWYHEGIDVSVAQGTAIKAFIYGTVALVGDNGGKNYGRFVIIQDDFNTTKFYLCAHLSEVKVEKDDVVMPGDLIGYVGNTGNSSGPHLHLMLFILEDEDIEDLFLPGSSEKYYYFAFNDFNKYVFDPLNHKIRRKG